MTPEEKARIKIDQMFEDAGWKVVDRDLETSKRYRGIEYGELL